MNLQKRMELWRQAGLLDEATFQKIAAFECERDKDKSFEGFFVRAAMMLGLLAVGLGIVAIVAANWMDIPSWAKLSAHAVLNSGFALGVFSAIKRDKARLKEGLLFLLAVGVATNIALLGQIYQTTAPLWQVLLLWLSLVTPFLSVLARARVTVELWAGLVIWFLFSIQEPLRDVLAPESLPVLPSEICDYFRVLVLMLVPFVVIGAGQAAFVKREAPLWSHVLTRNGYVVALFMAMMAFVGWSENDLHHDLWGASGGSFYDQFGVHGPAILGLLTVAALYGVMRHFRMVGERPAIAVPFMALTIGFAFLPALFAKLSLEPVKALVFMAYWASIGWVATRAKWMGLLRLSALMIALRLILVYVEVFGTLLQTGVGLITSGLLLLLLVSLTERIVKRLKKGAL